MGEYDDIIHLPHHASTTRPRMSRIDRAAQFSPFAALTGHGAAIKETARLTDRRIEVGEDARTVLDLKLNLLADMTSNHPEIAITYFKPDESKEGGGYVTATGAVKKIDNHERNIALMDGTSISIEEILEIESEQFNGFF